MKRVVLAVSIAWLVGVLIFTAFTCLHPVMRAGAGCGHADLARFLDFTMRMNEAECLRKGVDPFDVWSECVFLPPYYSNCHKNPLPDSCCEMTNAYVPWEYSFALLLSFLPRWIAWVTYCALMLLSAFLVFALPVKRQDGGLLVDALLPSAVALGCVAYPLWSNAAIGNLSVFCLAGAVGMAWCLNRGKDVAAGLCWAVVMLKPQLGLPFFIPLCVRMKWKTVLVAAGVCVCLSIPPSVLCGKSFVGMIIHAPSASAFAFEGCGTWPKFLCGYMANSCDVLAGTVIGAAICWIMTRSLRSETCWFEILMPAAITSSCWTYTQSYSHAMGWFLAFVLVRELVKEPRSKFLWGLCVVAFVVLARWFLAWHGLCTFAGWRFPMSEYAFRCVDSLNSTLTLAVAVVICVWRRRNAFCAGGVLDSSIIHPAGVRK